MSKISTRQTGSMESIDLAHYYDREYFLKYCDGAVQLKDFNGTNPPLRLKVAFERANPKPGERALDVGCGRGELCFYAAYRGIRTWGVDYSPAAVELARNIKERLFLPAFKNVDIRQADDWTRQFGPESFEIIFMCDIIEHLYPEEVDKYLQAAYRLLVPGGRMVIHTMPNRFMGSLTNKLIHNKLLQATIFKVYARLVGMKSLNINADKVHINEQSVGTLRATMEKTPFQFRVWCEHFISPEQMRDFSTVFRKVAFFGWPITAIWPLNRLFANDLWVVAVKPDS